VASALWHPLSSPKWILNESSAALQL
jgi:hypothetical protein